MKTTITYWSNETRMTVEIPETLVWMIWAGFLLAAACAVKYLWVW